MAYVDLVPWIMIIGVILAFWLIIFMFNSSRG